MWGKRGETERLDAPWRWLPRRRGLLRACSVAALLLAATGMLFQAVRAPSAETAAAPAQRTTGTAQPATDTPQPTASTATPAASCGAVATIGPPRGMVGFPLHLTDSAVLAVVRAGDRVDILVQRQTQVAAVAANLPVLRALGSPDAPDGVLYLAVSPDQAGSLAAIAAGDRVSVTVRSPSP